MDITKYKDAHVRFLPSEYGGGYVATIRPDLDWNNYDHLQGIIKYEEEKEPNIWYQIVIKKLREQGCKIVKKDKSDIKKLFNKYTVIRIGFTKLHLRQNNLSISHGGNMGESIDKDVNPNLRLIEFPTIEELKSDFQVISESGSPDYMYEITFNLDKRP